MHDKRQQMIALVAKQHAQSAFRLGSFDFPSADDYDAVSEEVPDFDPESDDSVYYDKAYRMWLRFYERLGKVS